MSRNSYLKRTYGITEEEYNELLRAQGGVCAICGKRQRRQRLSVDHDHVTGTVRGLVCLRCNQSLGAFEWDDKVLARLLAYIAGILEDRLYFAQNVS